MHSSIFLEAKNEEKLKQKFSFFFHQVKIKFAHFGGLQNSNYIIHVKFYSYRLFFEVNGRFMQKNKIIFRVPEVLGNWKHCRAHEQFAEFL